MVAAASGTVLPTYSQESAKVGSADISNVPAHVCTSNPYSAPVGVAAAITPVISVDLLKDQGVCMFGTNDKFVPPFVKLAPSSITVTEAGYDVYAITNPMMMPPTFVKQPNTDIGIYGITKTGLTAAAKITVQATAKAGSHCNNADGTAGTGAACTYKPLTCEVKPGFITFAPVDPN